MLATNMSAWAQDVFREMSYSPKQTVFYLNSPKRPTLSLWSDGAGGQPLRTVKMRADGKNRWKATVKGDLKGQFYSFNIGPFTCRPRHLRDAPPRLLHRQPRCPSG